MGFTDWVKGLTTVEERQVSIRPAFGRGACAAERSVKPPAKKLKVTSRFRQDDDR